MGGADTCGPAAAADLRQLCRFGNDDGCGDVVIPYGIGSELQIFNVLSAVCYAIAGAYLCCRTGTSGARQYGVLLILVSIGSASLHASSGNTGFLMDIVPMAISGGLLLNAAIHVLQLHADHRGREAEGKRFVTCASLSAFAVWVPWALMEAGVKGEITWAVWAVLFGLLETVFGFVALFIFREYVDPSGSVYRDIGKSVVTVLLGLGCTVHSFVPGLCAGVLTQFPFHALWHLFSAFAAFKCGCVLDSVLSLTASMEVYAAQKKQHGPSPASGAEPEETQKQKRTPLLIRMFRDAMPSQFSM